MVAGIESFTVFFATCPTCGWEGPERESARDEAEDDASRHDCKGSTHA